MGRMGLLGPMIPKYGIGTDYLTYGLMAKSIERVDSGYRSMFSVQSSLVMGPIEWFGSEEQKSNYLPKLASGEMVGCFGLTEPNHGSDPSSMLTTATPTYTAEGPSYELNGSKMWITNAPLADLFVIWAKLKGEVRGFLVERNTPGLETSTIRGKLSLCASTTGSITMDSVKVSHKALLPKSKGLGSPFKCLFSARLGIAFGAMGAAEDCIETVVEYVNDRQQFGKSLSSNQLIQYKLTDMVTKYNTALATCYVVAQNPTPEGVSLVKRNSCLMALDIARTARDCLGGYGISIDYNIMRHLINLETVNTYEGTADIHALIVGKHITNKSAF